MKKIIINAPQITPGIDSEHCRLSTKIESDTFSKDLYYEVENEYREYLCAERGDAFMIALLYFSMVNGYDMDIKVPVSEKLYYQITEQYIPTMEKYGAGFFKHINITAPFDNKSIANIGGVGTSASGGIDSFYTIIKNSDLSSKNYNITHLLIADIYPIFYDEKNTRQRFEKTADHAKKVARALGLPLVKVYSNEHEFWFERQIACYTLRYMGFVYALQKLFGVYNFSSGYEYKDFALSYDNRKGPAYYDFLTAQLISNENLTIYSSGPEASRVEKTEYIADNAIVQNELYVCNGHSENCCICSKCMRTQLNLYAIEKLDKFKKAFPKEGFEKRKNKALINMLERREAYEIEILNKMRKNGIKIPFGVKVAGNIKHLIWPVKCYFRRFKFPTDFYYKYVVKKEPSNNGTEESVYLYNNYKDYAAKCADIVY